MENGNDRIELNKALISECSDELDSSLVFLDFIGLSQQIRWLQLLFFGGSYPMIFRNLRFVWELALRAYYFDCFIFVSCLCSMELSDYVVSNGKGERVRCE